MYIFANDLNRYIVYWRLRYNKIRLRKLYLFVDISSEELSVLQNLAFKELSVLNVEIKYYSCYNVILL